MIVGIFIIIYLVKLILCLKCCIYCFFKIINGGVLINVFKLLIVFV